MKTSLQVMDEGGVAERKLPISGKTGSLFQ
jgi:hypothetical protein